MAMRPAFEIISSPWTVVLRGPSLMTVRFLPTADRAIGSAPIPVGDCDGGLWREADATH
jgi:hypothetical protein